MKTEVETRLAAEPELEAEPRPRERITLGSLILNFFEAVGILLGGFGEAYAKADKEEEEKRAQDPSRAYLDPSHPNYLLWNNRRK